jgi:hypothetical protein
LIKVLLDYGHLELFFFGILFVGMGTFCDFCQESLNVKFGCKLIWIKEMEDGICQTNVKRFNVEDSDVDET